MSRTFVFLLFVFGGWKTWAQQFSMSVGVYTGITAAYTYDKGINKDPRYEGKYQVKFAPIGINIGLDYEHFGLMISPGLFNVGQNFYVVNTLGGHDGLRKIELQYLNIPVAFKVHLVNVAFFRVSVLASLGTAFLLKGKDELNHGYTKLEFPEEVYPILPPDYAIEYDGVLAPEKNQYTLSQKKDFRSVQVFAGAGIRSDWDPSNQWRVSIDFRVNYGIFDPRTDAYTQHLESNLSLYEMPGKRRDMFAQFTIGISRYIELDKNDQERKKKLKGSSTRYKPANYPWQKPRKSKPKD